jgi:UTP--glucose-1-phosphate uridylyltransferase
MSDQGLSTAMDKMRAANCTEAEIAGFAHLYRSLAEGATGQICESAIDPLPTPSTPGGCSAEEAASALAKTALLRLNGGLGTSMGLEAAKTLLPVRAGRSFLDVTVEQVRVARRDHSARLPLLFMNSFRTQADTLASLAAYPDLPVPGIPLGFLQSQYPKIAADDLSPVTWAADPSKEWCPPGHGEVFAGLASSGALAALLEQGFRYLNIANGDNLGAFPNGALAGWFAASGAPFAMEVCERTANDRKGGHLAVRRSDGRIILRELAQTPAEDVEAFQDASVHRYFNTNNLWVDLVALSEAMQTRESHLGLPLIRNRKTVDPADPTSTAVIQLETAMGAAIEVFEGSAAVLVDRSRFLPVKTTNELLLVRSDLFELTDDARLVARSERLPRVDLDPRFYQVMSDFEQRFPHPVSLSTATGVRVRGDWTFGAHVTLRGDVELDSPEPVTVADGAVIDGSADDRAEVAMEAAL